MTDAENLARLSAAATQEAVARLIDPSSWRVMDSELERMKRKYRGQNIGWPAGQFQHKESMAKAGSILDFLTRSGRLVPLPSVEEMAEVIGIADNQRIPDGFADGYPDHLSDWDVWMATALYNLLKGTGDD